MEGSSKYIFNNAIIILMTLLLCLSCDVKREVKQTLNIPVAHLEHFEKPNKAIVCNAFIKSENQKISVSFHKEDTPKPDCTFSFTSSSAYTLKHSIASFLDYKISVSVPIYILHEQYLI